MCHDVNCSVTHFMDCCDLTYRNYIVDGKIDIDMYISEFYKVYGISPNIRIDGNNVYLINP